MAKKMPAGKMESGSMDKEVQAINKLRQLRNKKGREMDLILPDLYVGSLRDAQDIEILRQRNIKFIVTLLDFHRDLEFDSQPGNKRLIIKLADTPQDDILDHIPVINDFVHQARLDGSAVLIHCIVGVSRSISIAAAYLMSVTRLKYPAALAHMQARRSIANPNFGFRMQLCKFSTDGAKKELERLRSRSSSASVFDTLFQNDCIFTHSLYAS